MIRVSTCNILALTYFLLHTSVRSDCPEGCPSKCPDPTSIQTSWVKENFSLDRFWGTFYELAFHDNTQPKFMSCQRSVKSLNHAGTSYKDLFSLHIVGNTTAVCDLEFNITSNPGCFLGHWTSQM